MGLNRFSIILENYDCNYKILILEKYLLRTHLIKNIFEHKQVNLRKKKYKIFIIRVMKTTI